MAQIIQITTESGLVLEIQAERVVVLKPEDRVIKVELVERTN